MSYFLTSPFDDSISETMYELMKFEEDCQLIFLSEIRKLDWTSQEKKLEDMKQRFVFGPKKFSFLLTFEYVPKYQYINYYSCRQITNYNVNVITPSVTKANPLIFSG